MNPSLVLLESHSLARDPQSFAFSGLCGEVIARQPGEVLPALAEIDRAVAGGRHAAGFISYEAASGLDTVLNTRQGEGLPLLWFGLFQQRHRVAPGSLAASGTYSLSAWQPSISRTAYDAAIRRIRAYIQAGDTYQVNFTFRMRAGFNGDDRAFYRDLCQAQRASYCAYLDLGRYRILSASPELFFSLKDGMLTARPMKGTRPRGRWPDEDERLATELRASGKDQAENVMIVDLLRNDLGRVSEMGSVVVPRLWEVERYETVLQMTSTVTSRLGADVGLTDLLTALFPCGSVTGAPKIRTMEIISNLEDAPRGIYTGSIGYISPGPEIRFNVAIRTVWIDLATGRAEFGVGGGITFDSSEDGEYEECMVKSRVLTAHRPEFDLLETLLFEPGQGYFLLNRHLDRLARSACYFGFDCDTRAVSDALEGEAVGLTETAYKVRLVLSRNGGVRMTHEPLPPAAEKSLRVALAEAPVDSRDPMLCHKTTCRTLYQTRLASHPDCDEVILQNERGEVTECGIGNLVARIGGKCYTPPLDGGLLPGTYREDLLARGEIHERVLNPADLDRAEALYMINSVRRWVVLEWVR